MSLHLSIPAIIFLILWFIGLITAALSHGKERVVKTNFPVELVGKILSFLLLYWGGFFK